jgi:DNA-binding response OmpR family regulator
MQPIVIIDDSPMIRFALSELLEAAGHPALAIDGGSQGIETIQRLSLANQTPLLFVVDLVMDDANGFEVIGKARACFPTIPILAISGGTRSISPDLSLELARQSGADACLQKPFANDEFLAVVRRLSAMSGAATRP